MEDESLDEAVPATSTPLTQGCRGTPAAGTRKRYQEFHRMDYDVLDYFQMDRKEITA